MDPDQTAPFRSSLIRVQTVCRYAKNRFEKFARIFSRRHEQKTFSDASFLGILRVKEKTFIPQEEIFSLCWKRLFGRETKTMQQVLSQKRSRYTSKGANLLPKGAKFFSFEVDPFSEGKKKAVLTELSPLPTPPPRPWKENVWMPLSKHTGNRELTLYRTDAQTTILDA